MLDYVKKELVGEAYKCAHRQMVDVLRKTDRSSASATGKYMQVCIKHHITESYDEVWGKSPQAMSWLEDHANGMQDSVACATAFVLPDVPALAKEAEDANLWWSAALRWNAVAAMQMKKIGNTGAGFDFLKLAVDASSNIAMLTNDDGTINSGICTQFELDSFNLNAMSNMVLTWMPAALAAYGERLGELATTEAGKSRPVLLIRVAVVSNWFTASLAGDIEKFNEVNWRMTKQLMDLSDECTDAYSRLTFEERYLAKPAALLFISIGGEAMMRLPEFSLDIYGPNGDKLLEWANAYKFDEHHTFIAALCGLDNWLCQNGADWLLTMQYGRLSDAVKILDERLLALEKVVEDSSSPTRVFDIGAGVPKLLACCHMHGQFQLVLKLIDVLGFTFDSVDEYLTKLMKDIAVSVAPFGSHISCFQEAINIRPGVLYAA
jgi:hypothetical protein